MDLVTVDRLLTTTRSVRRRLDVGRPVERGVLERCIEIALQAPTGSNAQGWPADDLRARQFPRMYTSAAHLKDHLHEVPVLVLPRIEGRFENAGVAVQASLYGSILPAVWSFMLALRARGIGSAWTTDHLFFESEAAEILGIPETVTQVALLPVAYFTGADFKPARRLPARERMHWNGWGAR